MYNAGNMRFACTIFLLLLLFAQGTVLAKGNVILHVIANSNSQGPTAEEGFRIKSLPNWGLYLLKWSEQWRLKRGQSDVWLIWPLLPSRKLGTACPVAFGGRLPLRAYREKSCWGSAVCSNLGKGQEAELVVSVVSPCALSRNIVEPGEGQEIEGRIWLWEKIKELFRKLFQGSCQQDSFFVFPD